MITKTYNIIFFFCGILCCLSCIEEIEFETASFESALVVNAIITDENKPQVITLGKTYDFETNGPNPETQADVRVSGNGNEYIFEETSDGKYVSSVAFAAEDNIRYQLKIVTQNGRQYTSETRRSLPPTEIDAVYAVRETNDDGVNGISIYVDSFDPSRNSQFYRYEYEETYKIEPPSYVPEDIIITNMEDCEVALIPRAMEKRLCYNTQYSENFNLTSTTRLSEDRVSKHLVRFVSRDNYIITSRYSILVRQFVHSPEAFDYLETISSFSNEGSLFSQIQPGFISGNISSDSDDNQLVVGLFEVATVDTKRIFFSYEEFYPNEPSPPWSVPCTNTAPLQFNRFYPTCGPLIGGIFGNTIVYFRMNDGTIEGDPYVMVPRECGDCTALGTIEEPDFWIE